MSMFDDPATIQQKLNGMLTIKLFKFLGNAFFLGWVTYWLMPWIIDIIRLIKA